MAISRPPKLSHVQTILYEIDMLHHTAAHLVKEPPNDFDSWACLESFLVHFRNLIEFFGKPAPWGDDLSVSKPDAIWTVADTRPPDSELAKLARKDLWDKYESAAGDSKISKYLHHCTQQRVYAMNWPVGTMHAELAPTLEAFEGLLPNNSRPWNRRLKASISKSFSASTASGGDPLK
jgi:hypothetical protein